MQTVKRIHAPQIFGLIIDVQKYFLDALPTKEQERLEINLRGFLELLNYLRIPYVGTNEKPLDKKGTMPDCINQIFEASDTAEVFEKEFFDLTKHREITTYIRSLKKRQVLVAGSETDVCVLQSVLGLLEHGYEVYVVEDLIFSSTTAVQSALDRMRSAGAVFITMKTLYYELLEAVEASPQRQKLIDKFGPFPAAL